MDFSSAIPFPFFKYTVPWNVQNLSLNVTLKKFDVLKNGENNSANWTDEIFELGKITSEYVNL